jgi:hypothetical protein
LPLVATLGTAELAWPAAFTGRIIFGKAENAPSAPAPAPVSEKNTAKGVWLAADPPPAEFDPLEDAEVGVEAAPWFAVASSATAFDTTGRAAARTGSDAVTVLTIGELTADAFTIAAS